LTSRHKRSGSRCGRWNMNNEEWHDAQAKRIPGWEFGNEICEALGQPIGEDGYGVKGVVITVPDDDVITVTIERHVRRDEMRWLLAQLDRFALVPIERMPELPDAD